jgi:hypothetical protein
MTFRFIAIARIIFLRYIENMNVFLPRPKQIAVLLFFSLIMFIPVNSVSADNLKGSITGNILCFPADNGVASDPFPILPSLGGVLSLKLVGPLRIEFTEDIYIKDYEFDPSLGYPAGSNPENRHALVIGFITGLQFTGNFSLGNKGAAFRIYAGPAADLRVVALAVGLNHPSDKDAQSQADAIRDYFWSGARWFMPAAGIGMDFPINEKFLLGFDLRAWFPVYKKWTDENLPAIEGWRFGAGIRITPHGK